MLNLVFAITVLLEIGLYTVPLLWRWRRFLVLVIVPLVAFCTFSYSLSGLNAVSLVLVLAGGFRIFNLLRIAEGRMQPIYLLRTTRRSGAIFCAVQAVLVGLLLRLPERVYVWTGWWLVLSTAQLIVAACLLAIVLRNLVKSKHGVLSQRLSERELPSVSVCIPARNETNDLEACLHSVLASDYPKLEVIVLDDCSQDRTAEIIRTFAHDGVRFVPGDTVAPRWLAKNQAYDKLLREASGELVLFCGVDVRFGPTAIRDLVTTALLRKKQMISVMPVRRGAALGNAFIQPMRYWWELAIPRKLLNRPAVLSTCWLIQRERALALGGFAAVQHAVIPEGYFARALVSANAYSFVRASDRLSVETTKGLAEQRDTSLRTRYPQIRRRPEMLLGMTLAAVVFFILPFVYAIGGFWWPLGAAHWLAITACGLLISAHLAIIRATDPANSFIALVNFPVAVLVEMYIDYLSMVRYEFSTVEWKGRNVCEPVMHSIPRLPPPDNRQP